MLRHCHSRCVLWVLSSLEVLVSNHTFQSSIGNAFPIWELLPAIGLSLPRPQGSPGAAGLRSVRMVRAKVPLLVGAGGVTGCHPQGSVRGVHGQARRLREVLLLRDQVVGLQERQRGLGELGLEGLGLAGLGFGGLGFGGLGCGGAGIWGAGLRGAWA